MSCTLTILGQAFDPDDFQAKSNLEIYSKKYKGQSIYPRKPEKGEMPYSVLTVIASDADFNSFNRQLADVKQFLEKNRDALKWIKRDNKIEGAFLDFGVNFNPKNITFSIVFPADVVSIAGELGIGLELSFYNSDRFE